MKYYKVINLIIESNENSWCLNRVENLSDFEVQKINYEKKIDFEKKILVSVDLDFGTEEMDFNLCDSGIQIVSENFKEILSEEDVDLYPIEFTNFNAKSKYYALKIKQFYDCVDEHKTEIRFWTPENTSIKERFGKYENLGKFSLDESKIGNASIFRLEKYFPAIIVNDKLRQIIANKSITGIGFIDTWTGEYINQ